MKKICALIMTGVLFTSLFLGGLASPAQAKDDEVGKLGVTQAGYDDMGQILQKLGYPTEEITSTDLGDINKLKTYSAIFINCAYVGNEGSTSAASTIAQYVKEGGTVYASDYAYLYINAAFPGKINFYNASKDIESAKAGEVGKNMSKVIDSGLASVIGKSEVEINFDLPSWVVMDSVGAGAKVLMTGPAKVYDYTYSSSNTSLQDKPYLVSFAEGSGSVLYTSFHNEAQNSADVEKILNWFGVWGKAGKMINAAQKEAGSEKILQEVIDGINQGQSKSFTVNSTGTFKLILNFGGSALNLKVTDPNGKVVLNNKVSSPPATKEISGSSGEYKIEIGGASVPHANYPFVVVMAGSEGAVSSVSPITAGTYTSLEMRIRQYIPYAVALVVILLLIIVVMVVIKKRKKNSTKVEPKTPISS